MNSSGKKLEIGGGFWIFTQECVDKKIAISANTSNTRGE